MLHYLQGVDPTPSHPKWLKTEIFPDNDQSFWVDTCPASKSKKTNDRFKVLLSRDKFENTQSFPSSLSYNKWMPGPQMPLLPSIFGYKYHNTETIRFLGGGGGENLIIVKCFTLPFKGWSCSMFWVKLI